MFAFPPSATHLITFFITLFFVAIPACFTPQEPVKILNSTLRDRVVVANGILMRKALFVGYRIGDNIEKSGVVKAQGTLFGKGGEERFASMPDFPKGRYGSLVFDLPYELPKGPFDIGIELLAGNGDIIAQSRKTLSKKELKPYFNRKGEKGLKPPFQEIPQPQENERFIPSRSDRERGYIIFSKSPLEYVYPGTRPAENEILHKIDLKVTQNEFEPFTFSVYPLENLGTVCVSITDLAGIEGIISKRNIRICHVGGVHSTIGLPAGRFRRLPTLLKPGQRVEIQAGRCQRFWFTTKVTERAKPGLYHGKIKVDPENGTNLSIPVTIRIVPFSLSDVPGVDYFMLMTYEFTELTMPWDRETKDKIYNAGLKVLQDYRNHGMTTLCPHSPFVPLYERDGSLCLEDIFATLIAAKDTGFRRPIIWYMGHLINTAKSMHPGNIRMFENKVDISRLRSVMKRVRRFVNKNHCPPVIFLPIDEPHDKYNDPSGKRLSITPLLLETIHESGEKSMVTSFKEFKDADYICSSKFNRKALLEAHRHGQRYMLYNNEVTTKSEDPRYARYIYGLYAWQTGIDGMSSWTFQVTQNARGRPMVADTAGSDIYLAYPSPNSPIDTIKWEAIREGIDDYKLIHQLDCRIQKLIRKGIDVGKYRNFLQMLRDIKWVEIKDSGIGFFRKAREKIVSLILDADAELAPVVAARKG